MRPASGSSSSRASPPGVAHSSRLRSRTVDDDRALVERQLGRPPRAFRRVVVRCPFGRPAVTEQAPLRRGRRAVPDDVLPHLPRTSWRRSRGSRPPAASSAGAGVRARRSEPWPTSLAAAAHERAAPACGRELPELGSAARRAPGGSSACTPTSAFALARPGLRARRADPRRGRAALARPLLLHRLESPQWRRTLESTRREWEEGYRRLQASRRRTVRRYERLLAQVDLVLDGAPPPRRPDVHARASSPRRTATPTAGCWRRCSRPRRRRAGRPARRSSRTRPSTSTRAARATTSREPALRERRRRKRSTRRRVVWAVVLRARLRDRDRARPGARGQPAAAASTRRRTTSRSRCRQSRRR